MVFLQKDQRLSLDHLSLGGKLVVEEVTCLFEAGVVVFQQKDQRLSLDGLSLEGKLAVAEVPSLVAVEPASQKEHQNHPRDQTRPVGCPKNII